MTHVFIWVSLLEKLILMHIVWLILKIIGLYLLLRGVITLIYRYILLNQRKRALWLIIMAGLGYLFVLCISGFQDAPTLTGWSAFLAVISIIPNDHKSRQEQLVGNQIRDARFELMGLNQGRKYFNLGLVLFIVGVAIGWILCFTQKLN